MKVLLACEYSAVVREAFLQSGHDAWSCDLLDSEIPGPHYKCDIFQLLQRNIYWDLIIAFPPCTYMAVCGNRYYAGTWDRRHAIRQTKKLWRICTDQAERICFENPASVLFPHLRALGAIVQYIHPWQFGHMEQKKTGLALHNLPELKPTENVYKEMMKLPKKERERIFYMSPSKDRGKERARFFPGYANAMNEQWGILI